MLLKHHWLLCNLSVIHMVHVFDGETPGTDWKSLVLLYMLNLENFEIVCKLVAKAHETLNKLFNSGRKWINPNNNDG